MTKRKQALDGLAVALATPFTGQGSVDYAAFRRIVRHVAQGGADVLVVLGSTGEAATLEEDERDLLIEATLEEAGGKLVLAGSGHNATQLTCAWTARARELGCHGALIVTPYYNKPMPRGLLEHFRAASKAAPGLPLIAYNVPGRTGTNLTPASLALLWEIDEVVAVKESSGNLAQIGEICRALPPGKVLLAGDDHLAVPSIALGAEGLVSVLGNVLPAEAKRLVEAARAGRRDEALRLHAALLPVIDALFCESNPIPLKAALSLAGLAGDALRLPLTRPEPATHRRMAEVLRPFLRDAPRLVRNGKHGA
jgi:4-hydroxy-tetrahydrodipicolinate synthase